MKFFFKYAYQDKYYLVLNLNFKIQSYFWYTQSAAIYHKKVKLTGINAINNIRDRGTWATYLLNST